MVHSTGASGRCDRDLKLLDENREDYSKEELVAELGAAYMMNRLGMDNSKTEQNTAGYLQSWMKALQNDRRMFVSAAAKAEAAVNYILGIEK